MAPDRSLDEALANLQARGTLSAAQVQAIRDEIVESPPAQEQPTPRPRPRNVIPEIIGYVGGALVVAAGISLVAQNWDRFTPLTHILLSGGMLIVLWAAAVALTVAAGGRAAVKTERHSTVRRLVAVLVSLAVPIAALLTVTVLDRYLPTPRGAWDAWFGIVVGSAAFTVAAIGAWWVRGPVPTIAVALSGGALAMAVTGAIDVDASNWISPLVVVIVGAGWLLVAPRILAVSILSEALGFAWLVIGLTQYAMNNLNESDYAPAGSPPFDIVVATWLARSLLIAVAVIAMTGFARGRTWPWAAGGVAAGVFAALSIGQGTMGWVVALFIAGVVLLALSGLMFFLRGSRAHMRSGADTPHSSSPLNST